MPRALLLGGVSCTELFWMLSSARATQLRTSRSCFVLTRSQFERGKGKDGNRFKKRFRKIYKDLNCYIINFYKRS